ncbi:hypothetical protein DC897_RS22650 [Vibrio parahaemolyticus]|uniref:hypothetical protein n=1 Tax=Vibrio parahaemolyticus TaxID=670 RepID=UPI000813920F|nr:hypothetical protein [Vibrio parahaemolyticus]EGQ8312635.1 hypothetical protein [Vibrio parahaemolyticus]EGQ8853002.1 hypothetical protein [Vibrio parahaemolyticus]EGQ8857638.1 hypothetical protein [Vibrio parahaemolyticus]EGQ8877134.1 hypothetical protein [Vibrio parahaemolyticus]EGQ8996330.1 hypothetical protein [Vibrio parahaemolyticus]
MEEKTTFDLVYSSIELFIKFWEVTVWPLVVVLSLRMFKRQLSQILPSLSRFKYGDFEANFDKNLAKAEVSLAQTNEKMGISSNVVDNSYNYVLNKINQLIEISPRSAVTEAWREVEASTAMLIRAYGYEPSNVQMSKVFRGIIYDQNLPVSLYEDYRRLMMLRNQATHNEEFVLTESEAERYVKTTIDLASLIRKLIPEGA